MKIEIEEIHYGILLDFVRSWLDKEYVEYLKIKDDKEIREELKLEKLDELKQKANYLNQYLNVIPKSEKVEMPIMEMNNMIKKINE